MPQSVHCVEIEGKRGDVDVCVCVSNIICPKCATVYILE